MRAILSLVLSVMLCSLVLAADGNRLTYLDEFCDPYYPHKDFPKLITPQWVGDKETECVVVLAIDDMRDPQKYETFLRPILDRLKQIDGRAPVSIMTNQVDPKNERLQQWLKEGLSLEVHTFDHPCPCLAGGDFDKAKGTYDKCVDLLNEIPGNVPVAFRMPCCDSLNTPSPRFWMEIFNKTTENGNFLTIDSSVFNIITSKDKSLPKEITLNEQGEERFRRYVPFPSFVNTIEDYPYPYVIGKLCWQFPCVVPSDWSAQHVQKPNNPDTVRDLKLALDACVIKQGVYNLVFHPHGWIRDDQIVELIDHAVRKHGKKVKFLNFRECEERLRKNLLAGESLRRDKMRMQQRIKAGAEPPILSDAGVRILDVNGDGYMDVVIGNHRLQLTRVWEPRESKWLEGEFPELLPSNVCFGMLLPDGRASMIADEDIYHFTGTSWLKAPRPKQVEGAPRRLPPTGDPCLRMRDFDHNGVCEAINMLDEVWVWNPTDGGWDKSKGALPDIERFAAGVGSSWAYNDPGIRYIDLDGDNDDDIVFANESRQEVWLFESMETGWKKVKLPGQESGPDFPPITIDGLSNGAFFHSKHLWWQNEDTQRLPDHVDRRSFAQLLGQDAEKKAEAAPAATEPTITPTDRSAAPGKEASEENLKEFPPAKSPEDALKSMSLGEGLKIELVAAEPLVVDPVAFDWGPDGRLWVVEMRDYPRGLNDKGQPGGRVKVLTDKDGDGQFDEAKIFLDDIPFPNGIKVWRKGILITAAPDVIYAEDTNGDDVADVRRTLYRGFAEGNQQHRVNGLRYGLDGWLYLGNGDSGGTIKSLATDEEVSIRGRDLRIRPDSGELDPVSGQTQFSLCFDDIGNRFGGNNSEPLWHYVLEDYYLRRNPDVAPPATRKNVPQFVGNAPVFPTSKTITRFNDYHTANRFTSACGIEIYRDIQLGGAYYGNSFVCEPVHNLVHREILSPDGVSFTSRRAEDERDREFLASSDNWFRPVMARTGPDGALSIADMYRLVIEHPTWIPVDWQQKLDLRAGSDKGRIYRVVSAREDVPKLKRLDKLTTPELVAELESSSGTRRDMVQQQIVWQNDPAAIEPLRKLASESKQPLARMQAICTLRLLGGRMKELLEVALQDEDPRVRKQAVRLCEPLLNNNPSLLPAIAKLVGDDDPQVRMQVAFTLGYSRQRESGAALAKLAEQNLDDAHIMGAIRSSINRGNVASILAAISKVSRLREVELPKLIEIALKSASTEAVTEVILALGEEKDDAKRFAAFAALLEFWERQLSSDRLYVFGEGPAAIRQLFDDAHKALSDSNDDQQLRRAATRILSQEVTARRIIAVKDGQRTLSDLAKKDGDLEVRRIAIAGLGKLPGDNSDVLTEIAIKDKELREAALTALLRSPQLKVSQREKFLALLKTLEPNASPEFQLSLIKALGESRDSELLNALLTGWRGRTPLAREQILATICTSQDGLTMLIDALRRGVIPPSQIGNKYRQLLLNHPDAKQRKLAEAAFAGVVANDRAQLITAYQDVLGMATDLERGQQSFAKRCATCHKLRDVGHAVGPDLTSLTDKSAGALLVAMLDPNRAVEDKFRDYLLITSDGQAITGIITEETGTSIKLLAAEGKERVVLRKDIETLVASGKSLMPEGFERDVSKQEMADIIAFVRSTTRVPKQFDGNRPQSIEADGAGVLELAADKAAIFGPKLVFEAKYKNLGWWQSDADYAEWTCQIPKNGKYRVKIEYACADDAAGDKFVLRIADTKLTGIVATTGSWDKYESRDTGEIELTAGNAEVVLRSLGPVRSALIDLRSIRLEPVK